MSIIYALNQKHFIIYKSDCIELRIFLRSCQLRSYSRISQHFMESEGSLLCSQEPSTGHYPEHFIIYIYTYFSYYEQFFWENRLLLLEFHIKRSLHSISMNHNSSTSITFSVDLQCQIRIAIAEAKQANWRTEKHDLSIKSSFYEHFVKSYGHNWYIKLLPNLYFPH
jgi:hypothetical protein